MANIEIDAIRKKRVINQNLEVVMPYDKKILLRTLACFVAISVLMKVTSGAGFAIIAAIGLFAMMMGNIRAMLWVLVVSNCVLLANAYFFPKVSLIFAVSHRLMLVFLGLCMASKVFGRKSASVVAPLLWIMPFVLYMVIPSLGGWSPLVSILKLLLFTTVFIGYAGCANIALSQSKDESPALRGMLVAAMAFFIFGSLLIIPFPSISYMGAQELANDKAFLAEIEAGHMVSLFKGMTWHSQMLGPLMSIFCVFLVGDMLFNMQRPDKLYFAMIAVCPLLVYKTSSRTAMAVLICGVAVMVLMFLNKKNVEKIWRARVVTICGIVAVPLLLLVFMLPSARQEMLRFSLKYTQESQQRLVWDTKEVMSSRQGLMDQAMYNWRKKPVIGNGFQVSEQMQYEKRSGLGGILSAPIEKGVWVTAVLEEGGVIGMTLFCIFWISAVLTLWAAGYCATSAMLLSLIVMNMAEFTMFSMSGAGGFIWCLIFVMSILEGRRVNEERIRRW